MPLRKPTKRYTILTDRAKPRLFPSFHLCSEQWAFQNIYHHELMDFSIWHVSAHCNYYPFYFLFYVLIGGKLLYNFVLVSAIQWHERVILIHTHTYTYTHTHIHTYIPFHLSLPLLPQLHPFRSLQSTKVGSLCYLADSHCFTYDRKVLLWAVKDAGILGLWRTGFQSGPVMRFDSSELLCNKVLLK